MDINLFRSLSTVIMLAVFLAIVWWAYSPARRERFESDARLVFDESDAASETGTGEGA